MPRPEDDGDDVEEHADRADGEEDGTDGAGEEVSTIVQYECIGGRACSRGEAFCILVLSISVFVVSVLDEVGIVEVVVGEL